MKKILALVSFLTMVAACMAPTGNTNMTSNSNTNSNSNTESRTAGPSEVDLIAKEKAGWDAIKKKDWEGLGKLLAGDFIDVEDDGVYDKAGSIASLKNYNLTDVTYSDWKMLTVDKDSAVLTYNINPTGTNNGQAIPPGPYRAAAAYVNRGGEWLGIYFQQTRAETMPSSSPSPALTAKPMAKAVASPTATAQVTGSDVTANEKMVWDALKNKNYDLFGSYLASDSIEVEPDGVYDKSGSVKGVAMFDFSKAELSEWKTVKFDDNASLVTYKAKVPGMKHDQSRHTTIWVNRSGKWQALFHQGTPVAAPPEK